MNHSPTAFIYARFYGFEKKIHRWKGRWKIQTFSSPDFPKRKCCSRSDIFCMHNYFVEKVEARKSVRANKSIKYLDYEWSGSKNAHAKIIASILSVLACLIQKSLRKCFGTVQISRPRITLRLYVVTVAKNVSLFSLLWRRLDFVLLASQRPPKTPPTSDRALSIIFRYLSASGNRISAFKFPIRELWS